MSDSSIDGFIGFLVGCLATAITCLGVLSAEDNETLQTRRVVIKDVVYDLVPMGENKS